MKKTLLATILLVSSALSYADSSCTVTLQASGTSAAFDLYEIKGTGDVTSGFDNGYDVLFNDKVPVTPTSVFIYAPAILRDQKVENWSIICTDEFESQALTVITNASETSYKLVFTNVSGDLALRDGNTVFNISGEGVEYPFTAAVNDTITGRFILCRPFTPDPDPLAICHIGDELKINKNPYSASIVVKNEAGEVAINVIPQATPQVISLADLPKGRYTVEFNDGKEVFVISVKPDVKPAN